MTHGLAARQDAAGPNFRPSAKAERIRAAQRKLETQDTASSRTDHGLEASASVMGCLCNPSQLAPSPRPGGTFAEVFSTAGHAAWPIARPRRLNRQRFFLLRRAPKPTIGGTVFYFTYESPQIHRSAGLEFFRGISAVFPLHFSLLRL